MDSVNDDGGIGAEVSNRLEEMFEEDDSARGPGKDSPINQLKALVYAIDWEITDETMAAFLDEVARLQQRYPHDKTLSTFLKILEAIGKYIKTRKAGAHPDAIAFIISVYKNFERVFLDAEMAEAEKKRLVSDNVSKFKDFKQKVISWEKQARHQPPAAAEFAAEPAAGEQKAAAVLQNQEAIDYIVGELRKTIKAEFHTLRQIIKNLGA